jgi:hypothetical protein
MGNPTTIGESLFDARVIMMIMCVFGKVDMTGGDGMNFSTRVHVVRNAWLSVTTSYHARH